MNKYEKIKNDMKESLRTGNKSRRTVLADMVAAIEKAAVAGRKRVEITDKLVDFGEYQYTLYLTDLSDKIHILNLPKVNFTKKSLSILDNDWWDI